MKILCRHCSKPITLTSRTHELILFHTECYGKFLKEFKDYGIRIGMRVHNEKRLPSAHHTLSDLVE